MSDLPVVVIGAGPQGLAAAAHVLERGQTPLVLEAGDGPAFAVSQWAHVRLFSPWPELIDPAAARLLVPSGWIAPEAGYPTGAEWISAYLEPLAQELSELIRYGARVSGVSRRGRDRLVSDGRAEVPFVIHVTSPDGEESRVEARAVIDASGTWVRPNPAGADGLPALGEKAAADAGVLSYLPPTPQQAQAAAKGHTIVVGSGHSALTAIIELAATAKAEPGNRVTWVLRRGVVGDTFGGGASDELPERGALGIRAREAVQAGLVDLVTGFRIEEIQQSETGVVLVSQDGRSLPAADRVVVLTGFRPDLSFLSEMRLDLDPVLQAPVRLAPEIDPNEHSCGSVIPHGAEELMHPEPNLYLVGMKSYGRAPTFLAMTGYEQVRSIAAELAGDHEAAARVELTLPDTGVCGGSGVFDETAPADAGGGCCGAPTDIAPSLPEGARIVPLLGAVSGR
jgi:thioredoxin reductase